jgi:hypothetical protein
MRHGDAHPVHSAIFDANAGVCANNHAVAIIIAGHLLAVTLILRGAIGGPLA